MDNFPSSGRSVGNVMLADCRARAALAILAEKWALLVIEALGEKRSRTSELKRRIAGISEKMLIQTLRRLEGLGVIERHDYREVPPRVEYELTERGWSLSPIVTQFDRWVEQHAFDMLPLTGPPGARDDPTT